MPKMISIIAHQYAGVELNPFDVFDVDEEPYVKTLIDIGRAKLYVEEEREKQEEQNVVLLKKPKTNRKLKLHTVQ